MEFLHNNKFCRLGQDIVETYARGYIESAQFNINDFKPCEEDPFYQLKANYLNAVKEINQRFGNRLPIQFYQVLGFMTLRQDPTQEERIPDLEHLLPGQMGWKFADAVLHALPLCSRLYFDVQTIINKHTGRILGHGCGCSCGLAEMPRCVIDAPMGDKGCVLIEETESFLRHLLGQCFLLHFGLPQGMGASIKMQVTDLEKITLKLSAHA